MNINMNIKFEGKKFRPTEKKVRSGWDYHGNPIYKDQFIPTSSYMKYLEEKREQEERFELIKLKAKLDYEMEVNGEVDSLDVQRYMLLVQKSYR